MPVRETAADESDPPGASWADDIGEFDLPCQDSRRENLGRLVVLVCQSGRSGFDCDLAAHGRQFASSDTVK